MEVIYVLIIDLNPIFVNKKLRKSVFVSVAFLVKFSLIQVLTEECMKLELNGLFCLKAKVQFSLLTYCMLVPFI